MSVSRRAAPAALAFALALAPLLAPAAGAQEPPMPPRPALPAAADTNDWEAYYDLAVERLTSNGPLAAAAMRWAAALDPSRAEPLYGEWVVHWVRHGDDFPRYMRDEPAVVQSAEVRRLDALDARARHRNPFVHRGLFMVILDRQRGYFREDVVTKAWIAYGRGELPKALAGFGRAVDADPRRHGHLRFTRAAAFVALGRSDSAQAELAALLADLREADAERTQTVYTAKDLLEYAVALLHAQRGDLPAAREALGRAVAENVAFAPAHALLGDLALAAGDSAQAVHEHGLAVELAGDDAVLRLGYGRALLQARRAPEAVAQFEAAVAAAPHYADARLGLALAQEAAGLYDAAAAAYRAYLARAPRRAPQLVVARRRLAAIEASAGG